VSTISRFHCSASIFVHETVDSVKFFHENLQDHDYAVFEEPMWADPYGVFKGGGGDILTAWEGHVATQ
jgi:hypothetical protein